MRKLAEVGSVLSKEPTQHLEWPTVCGLPPSLGRSDGGARPAHGSRVLEDPAADREQQFTVEFSRMTESGSRDRALLRSYGAFVSAMP